MYCVGLMRNSFRETVPSPDGGFVERDDQRDSMEEFQSRWLALVGKKIVKDWPSG